MYSILQSAFLKNSSHFKVSHFLMTILILYSNIVLGQHLKGKQVRIFQREIEQTISTKTQKVQIDKDSFAFRFYLEKEYFARLVVFREKEEWEDLKVGMQREETSNFRFGMSLAGYQNKQYPVLLFQKESYHALYYENENDKRLDLLRREGNYLKLEFAVNQLEYQGARKKVSDSELSHFYVAIWIDKNLNKILDSDELYKFIIEFIVS